jgi:ribosomal protein S18 acetylase RimI-like enzyme
MATGPEAHCGQGERTVAVKIRLITLKDVASYRQCVDAIAKESRHFVETEAAPLPEMRAQVRRNLKKNDPFFVAVDADRVVGFATVFSSDIPAQRHVAKLGMGLLPEYREKGLGTKLMTAVLKLSRRKFDFMYLDVVGKNRRARKLYEKMGFQLCARLKKTVKLPGGFDDTLVMQKQLKP